MSLGRIRSVDWPPDLQSIANSLAVSVEPACVSGAIARDLVCIFRNFNLISPGAPWSSLPLYLFVIPNRLVDQARNSQYPALHLSHGAFGGAMSGKRVIVASASAPNHRL
jgi:hypothetical protein